MKNRILAAAAALTIAATGFAVGRASAPIPAECVIASEAADATIAAYAAGAGHDRISEIDYPAHRNACKEAQ